MFRKAIIIKPEQRKEYIIAQTRKRLSEIDDILGNIILINNGYAWLSSLDRPTEFNDILNFRALIQSLVFNLTQPSLERALEEFSVIKSNRFSLDSLNDALNDLTNFVSTNMQHFAKETNKIEVDFYDPSMDAAIQKLIEEEIENPKEAIDSINSLALAFSFGTSLNPKENEELVAHSVANMFDSLNVKEQNDNAMNNTNNDTEKLISPLIALHLNASGKRQQDGSKETRPDNEPSLFPTMKRKK